MMSRLLVAIMSRTDERKVLTVLGAVASVVAVYLAFGSTGAGIEVAVFAAIAVMIALSRKA
ncbi:hypothetical protein WL32_16965 [Burkholderia cepacia]|nr:hypothetical protein WL32_16965 [Burkholderia cepacia]